LKSGDEVVTLAASFPTTINPIIQNGLIPVFLDVDLNTANVDCSVLESAITDKTKAIFFAHTLGNPFDLDRVMKIARKYNLYVVEDACDALGAKYDNKYVGTFGDIGTFSFYPAHHITMGEGGALVTNDLQLRKLIESFRDWGRDCCCGPGCDNSCGRRFGWQLGELPFGYDHKYIYSHIGYNLKLTDMQAAVGVEQLKKLPGFIEARKKNFERLYNGLEKYKKYFILPQATPKSEPSWFGFLISIRENVGFDRGELINCLEKNKISTRLLFAGNILKQPAYDDIKYRRVDTLENTDYIMNNSFFIGVYPGLSEKMIDYVVGVFDEFIKNKAKRLI